MSWEINGVTYDTPEVELNARTAGTDGRIIAKLNTKLSETTDAPLQIKEISTAKKAGYIVLYNPNSTEVSTAGLYLTDKPEKLDRWEIPGVRRAADSHGQQQDRIGTAPVTGEFQPEKGRDPDTVR